MDIVSLIISLLSGAAGGNVAGAMMKDKSLGTLGNTLAGIFGGGIGASILSALGVLSKTGAAGLDLTSILANVGTSGVGGAVVLVLISLIKNAVAK